MSWNKPPLIMWPLLEQRCLPYTKYLSWTFESIIRKSEITAMIWIYIYPFQNSCRNLGLESRGMAQWVSALVAQAWRFEFLTRTHLKPERSYVYAHDSGDMRGRDSTIQCLLAITLALGSVGGHCLKGKRLRLIEQETHCLCPLSVCTCCTHPQI